MQKYVYSESVFNTRHIETKRFPKTDLVTNTLNLEIEVLRTSVFINSTFKQIYDIPLLNNLFVSFVNLFVF